jgi:uncharacterized protein (DUF952 family)
MQIRHIALASDWAAALEAGVYRVSSRGTTIDDEGFIHASTPEQLQATAARFYADVDEPLVLLCMDSERLEAGRVPVVLEDGGGELFPHLYAELPTALVDEALPATFSDGALHY